MTQIKSATNIHTCYSFIISLLGRLAGSYYWKAKLFLLCLLLIFISTTPFFNFNYFATNSSWSTIIQQSKNILIPFKGVPGSHDANKVYRLTVPLLAKILSLDEIKLFLLQVVCGLMIIYYSIVKSYEILNDKINSILFMIGFSGCYIGYSAFYDVFGRIDAFGYLFILCSIVSKRPLLVFIFCFLTAWCDERGLINTYFTFIYWLTIDQFKNYNSKLELTKFRAINKNAYAVFVCWIAYFLIRWVLSHYFNFHTETSGVGMAEFSKSRQFIPIGVFSTFGSVWAIFLLAMLALIVRKEWFLLSLLAVGLSVNLLVVLMVTDINRSLSYAIPLLMLSLAIVRAICTPNQLRRLLVAVSFFSIIIPIYDFDSHLHYHPNLLIRLVTLLVGAS